MRLKKGEIKALEVGLTSLLEKNIKNTTLNYRVIKNLDLIKNNQDLKEIDNYNPQNVINELENKRMEKVKELCVKDEKGQPKVDEEGKVKIPDDKLEDYNTFVKELEEEYLPIYNEELIKYNEIAEQEIDINLRELDLEMLESFELDAEIMKYLFLIIKEGE